MPAADSPAIIVARFLKANNYNDTLDAFTSEAGLASDAGIIKKGDLTIEKILEEKKIFDLGLNVERLGVEGNDGAWGPSDDHQGDEALEERRDHSKYVVKVLSYKTGEGPHWIATAGWDGKILLYRLHNRPDSTILAMGPPVALISMPTNPEAMVFIEDLDNVAPILVATRRDSTSLHYYSLRSVDIAASSPAFPVELDLLGTQNLAPHSNAWIAFTPSAIALCPTDPNLMAVATSSVPHMKLMIVRLLVPVSATAASNPTLAPTQAAQARETLARQDREDLAIQINVSTLAPQTPYSTPQVCWRPDGSGVWVNGDDGALRGIEARTGKIITRLSEGGHEAGSKIRSIWAGLVQPEGEEGKEEEWLISGGFDRRLIAWKPEKVDAMRLQV